MAVRFIIGRAGTGKTHTCLEAIRDRLRQDPIDGPRLIFLVPEQASMQMERAILQPPGAPGSTGDIPGSHRAEVLSFQRLAHRVLDSAGGSPRQALTEPARAMVLRHLLAGNADRFQFYQRVARSGASGGRFGGLVERIGATISELIQEAVGPDDLSQWSDQPASSSPSDIEADPGQRAKFHDLRIIYQAYLDYLGADRVDPSQQLQVARSFLPRCTWLDGAELWVDGFASFSGQEILTLIELLKKCSRADFTMMMDPQLCESAASHRPDIDAARLFNRLRQTYQELSDRFVRVGVSVDQPLILNPDPPPRFGHESALSTLERSLFMARANPDTSPDAPSCVELVELPSRRVEVDYAVSRICRWIQDSGGRYRYRDVAIIVRDLEPYHDLLSEALAARDIPFFIDRRRSVTHHPLVELLRTLPVVARESMSLDSVRVLLKTGFLPLSSAKVDELENYLLAFGIAGIDAWRDEWSFAKQSDLADTRDEDLDPYDAGRLAEINASRSSVLETLDGWLAVAQDGESHTGAEWAATIVDWFDRCRIGDTMQRWADRADADGDINLADQHRQVWRDVISFLDDLAFAFADVGLTVSELGDVLTAGLSGLTLGLVPPTVDQVLVGSIERSRHPDIKAAVILGFNEGVFPKQLVEDSILNDDDRAMLLEVGLPIRPPARQRTSDEALLVYVAVTRVSRALVLTYAASDDDGKALNLSPYVGALCAACPGLTPTSMADPIRSRQTWDILSRDDLAERLVMEFRDRPERSKDDPALRGRWNELYDTLRGDASADPVLRTAFRSLNESHEARLSTSAVELLHQGTLRTSVSQLESYATCPFQHFAKYALRLKPREEATIESVDVGRIHHAVLEDLVAGMSERGVGFEQLTERELLDTLQESSERIASKLSQGAELTDARGAYQLRRTASELARIIRAQRKRSQAGTGKPRAAELPFGFDQPGSLPALELSTPAGRRVLLRGYIDRVDIVEHGDELLGVVIDYKHTREKHLDLSRVYNGLSLQLLAYLLVLAESGETLAGRRIRPIASLYVSLVSPYVRVEHPDDAAGDDPDSGKAFRPRGLILADKFAALDPSCDSGWSDHYSFFRKKDGSAGRTDHSDAVDETSFRAMLSHTRYKLGELADRLLDGDIAVNPYRLGTFSPCSWCSMATVCRFELGICDVRYLSTLKRSEVLKSVAQRETRA